MVPGAPVNAALMLVSCWIAFFWSISTRAAFFCLVPVIAGNIGMSASQSGILLGVFFFGYTLAIWLAGMIHGHRKGVILAGAFIALAAILALPLVDSYTGLLAVSPVISFGAGLYYPKGMSLLVQASNKDNKGRNLSIQEVAASLGMITGPVFAGKAQAYMSWDWVMVVWGGLTLAVISLFLKVRDEPGDVEKNRWKISVKGKVDLKVLRYAVILGCIIFLVMGFISVLPILMVDAWSLAPSYVATFIGVTRLIGLAGPIVAGVLSDRFGGGRVLAVILLVCFICMAVMLPAGYSLPFIIAFVIMSFAASGGAPAFYTALVDRYPPTEHDRVIGTVGSLGGLFGIVLAPPVMVWLEDHYSPEVTFAASAAVVVTGLYMCFTAFVRCQKRVEPGEI